MLMTAAHSCDRVLAEPPPEVQLTAFTDSGVEMQVEVSVLPGDREDAIFDLGAAIKRSFDAAGVPMPEVRMRQIAS